MAGFTFPVFECRMQILFINLNQHTVMACGAELSRRFGQERPVRRGMGLMTCETFLIVYRGMNVRLEEFLFFLFMAGVTYPRQKGFCHQGEI